MLKYILIILLFVVIIIFRKNHIKIKLKTFFKKGYRAETTPYGIYCYWNKQGSCKTQSCVTFLLENRDKRIYANMKSLKGIHYKYFSGFKTLLKIGMTESDCIIFYDELFKGLYKGKKMSEQDKKDLMDFMSQMRKRNIIFLTTCQEWLEIPIEFRRYVRYDIKCKLISIFGYPIIIKEFNDTEQIHWSQEDNEYVSPRINTIIEHGRKLIVNSYDTFEQISSEEIEPFDLYNEINYIDYIIPKQLESEEEVDIVEDLPVSQANQDNETSEKLFDYYTTTNSNRIVNSQFTNTIQNNNDIKIIDTSANFNNIDNDFWEKIKDTDFDDNVK